jgi:2-aminoethylphosphonate transport system ATP-binding protein
MQPAASEISGGAASVSPPPNVSVARQSAHGIAFDSVTVAYRGSVVLDRFALDVRRGEIMALIGPSGSGKTTALRAVAGFTRPTSGRVRIGTTDVTDVPPYRRDIGMVVQNYALFPHMKVEENVAFGLRARGAPHARTEAQVKRCLDLVGMSGFRGRYPRELSGGQQQRVAIARALAIEPRVLLLDEPLSALDAQIRRSMVEEIAKLHRDLPTLTILYVTHDQSEALTLADRIAILRDGRLCSVGPSQALYRRPPNRFTAEFLGSANLLPVRTNGAARGGYRDVTFGRTTLRVAADGADVGSEAFVCVRPHALKLAATLAGSSNQLTGELVSSLWLGDHQALRIDCAGTPLRITMPPLPKTFAAGEAISFCFDPDDASLIPLEAS